MSYKCDPCQSLAALNLGGGGGERERERYLQNEFIFLMGVYLFRFCFMAFVDHRTSYQGIRSYCSLTSAGYKLFGSLTLNTTPRRGKHIQFTHTDIKLKY